MEQAAALIKQKHFDVFGSPLKSTNAVREKLKSLGVTFGELTRVTRASKSDAPALCFHALSDRKTREIWLTKDLKVLKNTTVDASKGRTPALYGRGSDPRKDVGYE